MHIYCIHSIYLYINYFCLNEYVLCMFTSQFFFFAYGQHLYGQNQSMKIARFSLQENKCFRKTLTSFDETLSEFFKGRFF